MIGAFLGWRFGRRYGWGGIAVVIVAILVLASLAPHDQAVPNPPRVAAASPFWPVGSSPSSMCAKDAGVSQVMAVGGGRPGELPPGSEVACTDGAIQSIAVTP
jgi:hypothetical protein